MAELPSCKSMLGNGGESLTFLPFPQRLQNRKQTKIPAEEIRVAQRKNFHRPGGFASLGNLQQASAARLVLTSLPLLGPAQALPAASTELEEVTTQGPDFRPSLPLQETLSARHAPLFLQSQFSYGHGHKRELSSSLRAHLALEPWPSSGGSGSLSRPTPKFIIICGKCSTDGHTVLTTTDNVSPGAVTGRTLQSEL